MDEVAFDKILGELKIVAKKKQQEHDLFVGSGDLVKQLATERWPVIEAVLDKWEDLVIKLLSKIGCAQWGESGYIEPVKVSREKLQNYFEHANNLCRVVLTWKVIEKPKVRFSKESAFFEINITIFFYLGYTLGTEHVLFFNTADMGYSVRKLTSSEDLARVVLLSYTQGPVYPSIQSFVKSKKVK